MASAPQTRIFVLQAGRGIAALTVVAYHSYQYVTSETGALPRLLSLPLAHGYLGVDFFFVLSGFIIYLVNHDHAQEPSWPRRYVGGRLTRIYLPYWPPGIAMAITYLLLPHFNKVAMPWNWGATLTLLPIGIPALGVAWTLQHELVFYALAFLALRSGRVLAGAAAAAILIPVAALLGSGRWLTFPLIDLEFLFGVGAAWMVIAGRAPRSIILAAAGFGFIAAFPFFHDRRFSIVFALGIALLLVALVRAEREGRLRVPLLLVFLGDASYAVYLVHLPLVIVLGRLTLATPPLLAALACFLIPTLAGLAYHMAVERPLLGIGRKALHPRPGREKPARADPNASPADPSATAET